ncbi:MAG: SnoaL-like domain [Solirubrobacteraceae bacterium]|nr:SnoaL-like domain [Solirubrobacteraceae bacterium]
MSQENMEIVHRAIAAYMGNDEATVRELFAPDVVVSMRPDQPDVHEHRGYDGMLRASAEWLEAWDEQTFETARVWDAEDFVFVGTRESGRGKISGVPMEHDSTFVCTLSRGRIVRIQIFGSEREAVEAVGLAE